MRVLRSADHAFSPWKNGGGTTAEIAIAPPGATLDSFDWRISMARVASDGPFSSFPGIDRTLTIIDGAALRLSVDGRTVELTTRSNPYSFPGEVAVHATRTAGDVIDLNVMSRRAHFAHRVSRIAANGTLAPPVASILCLFCADGSLEVECGGQAAHLGARDSLFIEPNAAPLRWAGNSPMLLLIEVLAVAASRLRPRVTSGKVREDFLLPDHKREAWITAHGGAY
jgi:environmental stress-induced protein Ves